LRGPYKQYNGGQPRKGTGQLRGSYKQYNGGQPRRTPRTPVAATLEQLVVSLEKEAAWEAAAKEAAAKEAAAKEAAAKKATHRRVCVPQKPKTGGAKFGAAFSEDAQDQFRQTSLADYSQCAHAADKVLVIGNCTYSEPKNSSKVVDAEDTLGSLVERLLTRESETLLSIVNDPAGIDLEDFDRVSTSMSRYGEKGLTFSEFIGDPVAFVNPGTAARRRKNGATRWRQRQRRGWRDMPPEKRATAGEEVSSPPPHTHAHPHADTQPPAVSTAGAARDVAPRTPHTHTRSHTHPVPERRG
jgi:hypothetical protein